MEHKTDVLPVVERGRIIGQVDRLAIMEALSEIRPEGYTLTMHDAESADELLRRLDNDGMQGLATINRNFEFNAVWGRAEILQAQGKIPQVKIWQPGTREGAGHAEPRRAAGEPPPGATAETLLAQHTSVQQGVIPPAARDQVLAEIPKAVQSVVKQPESTAPATNAAPTISIVREMPLDEISPSGKSLRSGAPETDRGVSPTPAPGSEAYRGVAENLHREIENGRMAINTLAALDIPLLACHGSGSEIFHNRAFQDIRLRDAMHLKTDDLVMRAKDAIADSAFRGDLDIDKAVKLRHAPRGYECYCKAIRDYQNPTSRAFGYIFWLVPRDTPPPPPPRELADSGHDTHA